ncbi:MAG TPA: fused response regulator/phosphatase [Gammaproteobacteria bacterium]
MTDSSAALLVVDDNEDNRYTLTRRLKRQGYANLVTANDGREALEQLRKQPIDLVLLDIMMPEMSGYEVLEHVKADAALRDIPVIMISALEEIESVIRCIELGAEDYLSKPFNPTLLRARVGASLEKKRLRDEVRASLARLEQELDAARGLQLGMLPRSFPEGTAERPLQVHALMDPAREVGGDLYDAFYAEDGLFCFLVGDVSGKGAAAGMFMARTCSLARMAMTELRPRLEQEQRTPAHIAAAINRELCQYNRDRMFVTLFLGLLDPRDGTLTYINAGHPPPYLLRATGQLETAAGKPQAPIAVRAGMQYQNHVLTLGPGDTLFACSDGVAEALDGSGELYGEERLQAQLRDAADTTPEVLVGSLKRDVDAFAGTAPKADDVTLLAVRRLPAPG